MITCCTLELRKPDNLSLFEFLLISLYLTHRTPYWDFITGPPTGSSVISRRYLVSPTTFRTIAGYICVGTIENHGKKTTKITAEICKKNREIHGKITASTVKSEHGSEAPIVNV